jgi:hypothetical protein
MMELAEYYKRRSEKEAEERRATRAHEAPYNKPRSNQKKAIQSTWHAEHTSRKRVGQELLGNYGSIKDL